MTDAPLISTAQLAARIDDRDCLVVDCRFELSDPRLGARQFAEGHLPHAVYADLDTDLSDHAREGRGRHPLPGDAAFSALLSRWGVQPDTFIVCYDAGNGSMAARLWWMLLACGHRRAAVLDGGLAAWLGEGRPVQTHDESRTATMVSVHFDPACFVDYPELEQDRSASGVLLLDARAAPRFRGEVEPIDPVAGHVPGALNRPFAENLTADGRFKEAAQLRAEFQALLGHRPASATAAMCGSGVTACHNLLAMHHAGLPGARLFAPSWSGWISDPQRPVETG